MKAIRRLLLTLSLLTLIGFAGCGQGGGVLAQQSNLMQALSYAPTNTDTVYFTDWTLLKQYGGALTLTSKSDQKARQDFLLSIGHTQGIASFYNGAYVFVQDWATLWGWDTTDLLWETTLDGPFPPLYVLKVRPDLDLNPVMAHFTNRGFTTSIYQGATVYSHPLDLTVDWFNDTSIFNAAVIPDAHIIVVGGGQNGIHAVLDAHATAGSSLASNADFRGAAAQFGSSASAILASGTSVCSRFSDSRMAVQVSREKEETGVGALHSYAALGIGYQEAQGQPAGLIDMRYDSSQDAQADLDARRTLATKGLNLSNQPYSESLFTVGSASVSGSDLLLHVTPLNNKPQALFDMFDQSDLLFAICS